MERVKEEADNANEARYLHYGAYVVGLETAKVMEELSEPNRCYALAFKKHLELIGDKPRTVGKRLHELRYILKALNKDARKCTKADIEEFILAMNKSKYAPITRKKTKQTLRKFFKQLYGRDSYPKIVKWVVCDHVENFKLPEDMLTEDDVKALINTCLNPRDRCMIALLFDGGIRAGEFLRPNIKDLVFSKDNVCYITIKKGKSDAWVQTRKDRGALHRIVLTVLHVQEIRGRQTQRSLSVADRKRATAANEYVCTAALIAQQTRNRNCIARIRYLLLKLEKVTICLFKHHFLLI